MRILEQSTRSIDAPPKDDEAFSRTFAMDVNESFGNNKIFGS